MLQKIVKIIGGDPNRREVERLSKVVDEINTLEPSFEALSDAGLKAKTAEFRDRLAQGETLDDLLPEAFAAVREASKRTIGLRHFDVQMIGGMVLHQGKIAEMRTGEGKTLVATLPIYLNALTAKGVHLVTVNDYLARRDARWMGPIYSMLDISVGILQMAGRTENGRNAFIFDPEQKSPHEDQDQMRLVTRAEAYQADVTYGTNSEFGFDYLRDNLAMSLAERVQRSHHYAIVDEVDNILIDEARTPLIISGPASEDTEWYVKMAQVVRQLNQEDYEVSEKDRTVNLTELGEAHVEMLLDIPLRDPERPEDVTPEQARLLGHLEQALRAQTLFHRNKDYLVQGGKVVIVDEFTGRLMPGRRWSDGLHQAVEAKEGVKVEPENVTYATITLQNYFRMYDKLCGMTGTALTESEEFYKIYKLDVIPIPTNLEYQADRSDTDLVTVTAKDGQGYKYTYYTRKDDKDNRPAFWRRQDYPDVVFRTEEAKLRTITREILTKYIKGQPQLVGTTSVEHSERLSDRLRAESIRRLMQAMLIRQVWLEKNKREEGERAIPELQPLYRPLDELAPAELRQMARPLGLVSVNPEDESNLPRVIKLLNLEMPDEPAAQAELKSRVISVLQGGVPHAVLNARKHDEESLIIARAGAFGAVTIATNMAGRGVDIKLGGELPEENLSGVNRILAKAGHTDPYDMTMEQREAALRSIATEEYGIYEGDARAFLAHMEDMRSVRQLGGLYVLGTERHEARRIDNQLRGRAARQGDPGSSRFYLSLGDELMRLFGGQQVENVMARLNIDEALPIESGMVGRLVEQSQTRVEGSNFDIRKHLLEYDDVLNTQRERIYSQRDRVFTKQDLRDDVTEMLRVELQQRIPQSLKDEEGPWKLLAYLEETQPPIDFPPVVYPSYSFRLLLNELGDYQDLAGFRAALLELSTRAYQAEREHLLKAIRTLLEKTQETMEAQLDERNDALDTFLEGAKEGGEENVDENGHRLPPRRPQEVHEELSNAVRTSLRLSNEQLRQLVSSPADIAEDVRDQIRVAVVTMTINRLISTIERRIEEPLDLKAPQLLSYSWNEISTALMQAVEDALEKRQERLLGEQGQIAHDLDAALDRYQGDVNDVGEQIRLLVLMAQGARMTFDARSHRRGLQLTTRLRYSYLAARLVESASPQKVAEDVLQHLEEAQVKMAEVWGLSEWARLTQANSTFGALEEPLQASLIQSMGVDPERLEELRSTPLTSLDETDRQQVIMAMGEHVQSEIYRQLLLSVISELWVDYLTKVEALRVSIGLEAYAQRDPLVQYKGQASTMFQGLLSEIRASVISRMYIYRPRPAAPTPIEKTLSGAVQTSAANAPNELPSPAQTVGAALAGRPAGQPSSANEPARKKRKRH